MPDLLSVDKAMDHIMAGIHQLGAEQITLHVAFNRVLAQAVISAENVPPFATSAMDGFGVIAADLVGASPQTPLEVAVTMDVPAGVAPEGTLKAGQAARIMTGAPIPDGVDAVIPIEDTDGDWTQPAPTVKLFNAVPAGANIRPIGENITAGQTLLQAGTMLKPQDVGVIASVGQATVDVVRQPHVVIFSTGDELLLPDEPLTPGRIRDVNIYTLQGLAEAHGARVTTLPIVRDTPDAVRAAFRQAITHQPDVIISSGGVSVGAADFVRDILAELGQVNFWRINLRPGKPLAYGYIEGVPFFGLPGNPVSVMVTFDVFLRPVLRKMAGLPEDGLFKQAVLQKNLNSDGRRTYVRVKLEWREGQLTAVPTGTQSSGALMSMVLADGLLVLPEGTKMAKAGETYPVRLLRQPISI